MKRQYFIIVHSADILQKVMHSFVSGETSFHSELMLFYGSQFTYTQELTLFQVP